MDCGVGNGQLAKGVFASCNLVLLERLAVLMMGRMGDNLVIGVLELYYVYAATHLLNVAVAC